MRMFLVCCLLLVGLCCRFGSGPRAAFAVGSEPQTVSVKAPACSCGAACQCQYCCTHLDGTCSGVCKCSKNNKKYLEACKQAISKNEPLIMFVNMAAVKIAGKHVAVHVVTLPDYPKSCIVIGVPNKAGWLSHFETLKPGAKIQLPKQAKCGYWYTTADECQGDKCPGRDGCAASGNCNRCDKCNAAKCDCKK